MINEFFVTNVTQNLPFLPNNCQKEALVRLGNFLLDPTPRDRVFILRGYAGTGKTSLVGALVKTLQAHKVPTRLMAPTGRAAKVFASMAGKTALTIHKSIYRQKTFGLEGAFQLTDNKEVGALYICDEASMISTLQEGSVFGTGNLLDDLIEYVYSGTDCKLLLVGDAAQLPPVGQTRSYALDVSHLQGYGLEVMEAELTEVARQQLESGILWNATQLRNRIATAEVDRLPHIIYKGYSDLHRIDGMTMVDDLGSSYSREGIDETVFITRSNKMANRLNLGIRNRILDREEELTTGERLLVVKNNYWWARDYDQVPFIANGDIVVVNRVRREEHLYGFRFAHVDLTLTDYDIDLEVIVLLDTLMAEGPSLSQDQQSRLFYAVMEDYADIPSQRDRVRKVKENPYFNALQVKYGYAVTCHKSQGGQWQDVYLDLSYINPEHLGMDFYRWMYTAFTRARKNLYLVNMSDEMSAENESEVQKN